jgi:maltose O-acetyltransferase
MLRRLLSRIRYRITGRSDYDRLVSLGLELGRRVHIGPQVIIDPSQCWLISIGDDVVLAPRVVILAHDASMKRHIGYTRIARTCIGRRTFIGAGAIILPGVHIGDECVIGAGSVVTKDVPDGSVAAGNPAGVVQRIEAFVSKHKALMETSQRYSAKWTEDGGITEPQKHQMKEELADRFGYVE